MKRVATIFMTLIAAVPLLAADTITLRDGSRRFGTLVSSTGREITFDEESGVRRRYNITQVRSIEFDTSATSSTTSRTGTYADRANTVAVRTIPAGTELSVRTGMAIESDSAAEGRIYAATVEREVLDSAGRILVPREATAQLVVREVKSGGAIGSPELALGLQSLTFDGNTYHVSSLDVERSGREGIGANRRTATIVGGAAVLGTLIGAAAGGGKGAAIGALAGAAAGAGVQVLTRGKTVSVPAETVLTFRLDQPVTLVR